MTVRRVVIVSEITRDEQNTITRKLYCFEIVRSRRTFTYDVHYTGCPIKKRYMIIYLLTREILFCESPDGTPCTIFQTKLQR